MTIHVLVEGPSEQAFLEPWVARLLRGSEVVVHPHQGKGSLPTDLHSAPDPARRGLLHQLPAKLRGFQNGLALATDGVLVLVDADDDNCIELARRLADAAKTVAPKLDVVVRIAVEETEAFYLGDLRALSKAFPEADMALARAYTPDSICGTWEYFGRVVNDDGARKVAWAQAMGAVLTTTPARSRSPSFQALCQDLLRLSKRRAVTKKRRRFIHRAKKLR